MATSSTKNSNLNSASNEITAATDKLKHFCADKVDDANYYMEKKQRQFEISDTGSGVNRATANTKNWFDKQKQDIESMTEEKKDWFDKQKRDIENMTEEKKREFEKATGIMGSSTKSSSNNNNTDNRNENEFRRVGEDVVDEEGCGSNDFNCNSCGLFST